MSNANGIIETLRQTPAELAALVALLEEEAKSPGNDDAEQRRSARCRYHINCGLLIAFKHPGGTAKVYRVHPLDISERGLGFLHGQFLFPGTRCQALLLTGKGQHVDIAANVVNCRLLRGRVHQVGIEFNDPIDPTQFSSESPSTAAEQDSTPPAAESQSH